jgi:hypothetical protein
LARRSSFAGGEGLAAGLLGLGLMLAVLVIGVALLILISVVTELWRVFQARAIQPSPARRLLWGAFAALVGLWLTLAGLAALFPEFAAAGAAMAAWGLLAFILTCELVDWHYRRLEQPAAIPESIPLSELISFRPGRNGEAAPSTLQPVEQEV